MCVWRAGVGKQEGNHRGSHNKREGGGGLDVEFNTYRGITFYHSSSQAGNVAEELLEFKYLYLLALELNRENINSRCFDL